MSTNREELLAKGREQFNKHKKRGKRRKNRSGKAETGSGQSPATPERETEPEASVFTTDSTDVALLATDDDDNASDVADVLDDYLQPTPPPETPPRSPGGDALADYLAPASPTTPPQNGPSLGSTDDDPTAYLQSLMMLSPMTPAQSSAPPTFEHTPQEASLASRFVSAEVPEEDTTVQPAFKATVATLTAALKSTEHVDNASIVEGVRKLATLHNRRAQNLKSIIDSQRAHLQQLKTNELDLAAAEAKEYDDFINETMQENEELTETNEKLTIELDELKADRAALGDRLKSLQLKLDDHASLLETTKNEAAQTRTALAEAEQAGKAARDEIDSLNNRIDALERDLADARNSAAEANELNKTLNDQVTQLDSFVATATRERDDLAAAASSAAAKSAEELVAAQHEIERLATELRAVRGEFAAVTAGEKKSKAELRKLTADAADREAKLATEVSAREARIKTLDANLVDADSRIELLQSELTKSREAEASLRNDLASLSDELAKARDDDATHLAQLETADQEREVLAAQLDAATKELKAARAEAAADRTTLAAAQSELDFAENKAAAAETKLAQLESEAGAAHMTVAELTESVERLTTINDDLQARINEQAGELKEVSAEATDAASQLSQLSASRDQLQSDYELSQSTLADVHKRLAQAEKVESELRAQLAAALDELASAKLAATDAVSLAKLNDELETKLIALKQDVKRLEVERDEARSNVDTSSKSHIESVQSLSKQVESLTESLRRESDRNTELNSLLQAAHARIAELESAASDAAAAAADNDKFTSELDALRDDDPSLDISVAACMSCTELQSSLDTHEMVSREVAKTLIDALGSDAPAAAHPDEILPMALSAASLIGRLQSDLDEAEAAAATAVASADAALSTVAQLEAEAFERQSDFDELQTQCDLLEQERDDLVASSADSAQLEGQIRSLEAALADLSQTFEARNNENEATMGALRSENAALKSELAALTDLSQTLKARNAENEATLTALTSERDALQSELTALADASQAVEGRNAENETLVAAFQRECETLQADKADLVAQVEDLKVEVASTQLQVSSLESEINPMRQQVLALLEQNDTLEHELQLAQDDLRVAQDTVADQKVLVGILKEALMEQAVAASSVDACGHPRELKLKYPGQRAKLPNLSDDDDNARANELLFSMSTAKALSARAGVDVTPAFGGDTALSLSTSSSGSLHESNASVPEPSNLAPEPTTVEDLVAELAHLRRTNRVLEERIALYENPQSGATEALDGLAMPSFDDGQTDDLDLLLAFGESLADHSMPRRELSEASSEPAPGSCAISAWEVLRWVKEALTALGIGRHSLNNASLAAYPRKWLDALLRHIDLRTRKINQLKAQYSQAVTNAAALKRQSAAMLKSQQEVYAKDRAALVAQASSADVAAAADAGLVRELEAAKATLTELEAARSALLRSNAELGRDLSHLRELAGAGPQELARAVVAAKTQKTMFEARLNEVEALVPSAAEIDSLLLERDEARLQRDALELERDEALGRIEALELERDEAQLQHEMESADHRQCVARLELLEAEHASCKEKFAELEELRQSANNSQATVQLEAVEAELLKCESKLAALQLQYEMESVDHQQCAERLATAEAEHAECKTKADELERQLEEAQAAVTAAAQRPAPVIAPASSPPRQAINISLGEAEDLRGYLAPATPVSARRGLGASALGGSSLGASLWSPARTTSFAEPATPGEVLNRALASSNPMGALKMHLVSLRGLWQHEVKANAALRELIETMRADRDRVAHEARSREEQHARVVAEKDRALDELRINVTQHMAQAQAHSSSLVETISTNLSEMQGSQSVLSQTALAASTEANRLRVELESARDKTQAAIRETDRIRDQAAADLASAEASAANAHAQVARLAHEKQAVEGELASIRAQLEAVQSERAGAQDSISQLTRALQQCRAEVAELERTRDGALDTASAAADELERVRAEFDSLAAELETCRSEVRARDDELRRAKRSHGSLENSLESKYDGLNGERMALLEELGRLRETEAALANVQARADNFESLLGQERQIGTEASTTLVEIQTRLAQSELERAALDSQLRSARVELAQAQGSAEALREQLTEANAEVATARNAAASTRSMLQNERAAWEAKVGAAAVSAQQVQDSITRDFEAAALLADDNGRALAAANVELSSLREELDEARADARSAREEGRRLKRSAEEANRLAESREHELAAARESAARHQAEISELALQLADKRDEAAAAEEVKAKAAAEAADAREEVARAQASVARMQADLAAARGELETAQAQRAAEALANASAKSQLENSAHTVRVQLDDARHQLEDSRREVGALREELAAARRELAAKDASHRERSLETTAIASQASMAALERARTVSELSQARQENARLRALADELQAEVERERARGNERRSAQNFASDKVTALEARVVSLTVALDKEHVSATKAVLGFRMLQHHLERANAFRASLIYQKQYLILLLGGFEACEMATMSYLSRLGAVHQEQLQLGGSAAVAARKRTARRRFRVAAHVVRGIVRLRILARRFAKLETSTRAQMAELGEDVPQPTPMPPPSRMTPPLQRRPPPAAQASSHGTLRALNPSYEVRQRRGLASADLDHASSGHAHRPPALTRVAPTREVQPPLERRSEYVEYAHPRAPSAYGSQNAPPNREAAATGAAEREQAYARLAQLRSSTRAEIEGDLSTGRVPSAHLKAYLASIDDAMTKLSTM
ncbi:uncharacterized protein AMSG_00455 [Thecamonas trahens ATCC 50062]|uniref:Pericentrin/AKAP-450 centrosomal targeting domain-containing protein n=1 Tax=Thecamonas trahens ATCC 50062 TaxID=461836 RepID=A0A0L0DBK4_THETB|nr:hypothetical protein AMSG_00455 [Thecamonas trahens ATCC 50062]KNC48678.1 hypothetical protein AMSG_00455 [Thecamonas trahens ATCC 50062]|eukprot:XP_013762734.1 hypothetical protein AMSG_00455 [Thecamonas trahens ATCC 50062]